MSRALRGGVVRAETLVRAAEQAVGSLTVLVGRCRGGKRARGAYSITQLFDWPTWSLNFLLVVHGRVGDKVTRSNIP